MLNSLPVTDNAILPFPLEALGAFKEPVQALQQECQAAPEICFASAFMVLNHAAQAIANVKIENRTSPLSCFFITVAESGERKTSAEDITLVATKEYQARLEKLYQADLKRYHVENAMSELVRKKILASKDSIETKTQQLLELPTPISPKIPRLITNEPTMQGITRLFREGFPSILLTSSEGGQFFGSYAMQHGNQLHTLTTLSSVWSGSPIAQVKKDGPLDYLENKRMTLHLGVQQSIFDSFIKGQFVEDQGFLSRCLISVSESLIDKRESTLDQVSTAESAFRRLVSAKILSIYEKITLNNGDLDLRTIMVDPQALSLLKAFYYYGHKKCGINGVFRDLRGFVSKSVEHVLRIAATLTIYENSTANIIPLHLIESAIAIVRFYMSQQFQLFNQPTQNKQAQMLLNWILQKYKNGETIDKQSLLQYGPCSLRSKAVLDPLIISLEDSGVLKRIAAKTWQAITATTTTQNKFPIFTGVESKDD